MVRRARRRPEAAPESGAGDARSARPRVDPRRAGSPRPGLRERHRPFLDEVRRRRPSRRSRRADWAAALRGLFVFPVAGYGDEDPSVLAGPRMSFTPSRRYGLAATCGSAGPPIGDREVVGIYAERDPDQDRFGRDVGDLSLASGRLRASPGRARIKMAGEDACREELSRLRSLEATVNSYRSNNPATSIDEAKVIVLAAIAKSKEQVENDRRRRS